MKIAFAVPVYKVRKFQVLNYVNEIAKEYDVFIFTQTNCHEDYTIINKHKEEDNWADNVFVEECDCDNIAAKRYCMTNRLIELGYEGMLMCDDDIKFECLTTEGSTQRPSGFWVKKKTTLLDAGHKMIEAAQKYNAIYVGTSNNELQTANSAPGTVSINHSLIWTCYVYIDLVKHKQSGLNFIQVFDTFEQHDIQIQYILNGYNTVMLKSYCFISASTDVNSVIFGTEDNSHSRKLDMLFMNLFLKYGDYICLYYRNKTKLAHIGCRLRFNKMIENVGKLFYEPETSKTAKLHEIAKTGDLDKFLEELKNK